MKKENNKNISEMNYWKGATLVLVGLLLFTQLFNIDIIIGNFSNGVQNNGQVTQAQKYSNDGGCGV
jgi:hypothetical protein